MKNYDLIIIGTGSAGSVAAYRCRQAGWKVAVVDHRPFGGTCALRGCDPKKVLVGASEVIDRAQIMAKNGVKNGIKLEWAELMKFKRTFTSPVPEKREEGFASAGIDTFHGHAAFTGKNILRIGDEVLGARHFLIATGARPMKLGIAGEEHITISDQFLELDNLPGTITFIGGGYISFELAHVAARAGSKVRILHRSEKPLKNFDPDLVNLLVKASEEAGVEIHLNMPVNSVEKRTNKLIVRAGKRNEHAFESDMVIHGSGRIPDIDDLNLEKTDVNVDEKGRIVVNEYLQSVSNPAVYVAGDANAFGIPLTPVAGMESAIVAENLLRGNVAKPDYAATPSVVFTTPPLASVGLQEEDAKKQGLNYKVNYQDTSWWYSSRRIGLKHSSFKVVIDSTNRVLGAHLLGHNAEEVINIFAMAIKFNLTVDDLKNVLWAYPTSSSDISYML